MCVLVDREKKRDASYRHKQTELDYVNSNSNSNSNCICYTRIALQVSQVFVRKMKYYQVLGPKKK